MNPREQLVDLVATEEPETTTDGEKIVVSAPVVFANDPNTRGRIRLSLSIEQAEYLAGEIRPVIKMARANIKRKK
jgi:hypothetical protein